MSTLGRWRYRVEATLAAVSLALLVLTVAWPDWIEALLGVNPDAGSGEAEWALTFAFLAASLVFGALARRQRARVAALER